HPEKCKGIPTESSFRIICSDLSYGDNPPHLYRDKDHQDLPTSVEECVPFADLKGDFDKAGRPLVTKHPLECGHQYYPQVLYWTKGQELPNDPVHVSIEIQIGPIKVTVPAGFNQYCNVYTPIINPDTRGNTPGECGGQALQKEGG